MEYSKVKYLEAGIIKAENISQQVVPWISERKPRSAHTRFPSFLLNTAPKWMTACVHWLLALTANYAWNMYQLWIKNPTRHFSPRSFFVWPFYQYIQVHPSPAQLFLLNFNMIFFTCFGGRNNFLSIRFVQDLLYSNA